MFRPENTIPPALPRTVGWIQLQQSMLQYLLSNLKRWNAPGTQGLDLKGVGTRYSRFFPLVPLVDR